MLQPGNVVANIIAGGVAEVSFANRACTSLTFRPELNSTRTLAEQSPKLTFRAGDLMQDLKTGHLLRASPRSQFYGQMIGSLASVFVSTAGYKFYTSVYTIPGPQFAVPSAGVW